MGKRAEPEVTPDSQETRREPSPEIMAIPERVALALKALKSKGVSAHQVAQACGIPDSRFSKLTKGQHVGGIQADMVQRLARALRVDPGWLLCGDGSMTTAPAAPPGIPASAGPGAPTIIVVQAGALSARQAMLQAAAQLPDATEGRSADQQRRPANPRPASQQGSRKRDS